jgi:PKD domain-containing protein
MSRLSGMERSHLPDYSIGATVLVVAIALPFFVFTRAELAHRAGAARPGVATPSAQGQAVITPLDPTPTPSPSRTPQALPSKAAAAAAPAAKQVTPHPTSVSPSPTSAPTVAPTATPTPGPDAAPVAVLTLTVGAAPLIVTADASGSTDTDQTPIAQVIFNFGDGTPPTTQAGRTATHTYATPGTYTVAVTVIDTAHLWSTMTATVTVS